MVIPRTMGEFKTLKRYSLKLTNASFKLDRFTVGKIIERQYGQEHAGQELRRQDMEQTPQQRVEPHV